MVTEAVVPEAMVTEVVVTPVPGLPDVGLYSHDGPPPPLPHNRAMWSLFVLALAVFVFSCNEGSALGVISVVADDFGRSEAVVGLMTTVFSVVGLLVSIPAAILLTRFPRRHVLAGTVAVLTIGLVIVSTAPTFEVLLAGRAVTALGHASFWAIVTPTVAGMFAAAERGKSVSRLLLGASASGVLGIPAVTWLAQNAGWRAPYVVLAVAAGVLAIAVFLVMPTFRASQGTAAHGELPSWPIFVRILVVAGLTVGSFGLTWTFITPFATEAAGMPDVAVPTLLLLGGVAGLVSMWLVAKFLDRFPVRSVAFGLFLLGSVWAGMALFGATPAVTVACVVLQGAAWSVLVASMVMWALRHAPGSTDTANALYATVFNAGIVVGSLIGAGLLASVGATWLPVASLLVISVAGLLVWTMRGRGTRVEHDPTAERAL